MNWKNIAIYAVVGVVVVWLGMEMQQWNFERRMLKSNPASTPQEEL